MKTGSRPARMLSKRALAGARQRANKQLLVAAQVVKRLNCLIVQADIDRNGLASAGTCWWDVEREKLRDRLPDDACWVCKLRQAVAEVEQLAADFGSGEQP